MRLSVPTIRKVKLWQNLSDTIPQRGGRDFAGFGRPCAISPILGKLSRGRSAESWATTLIARRTTMRDSDSTYNPIYKVLRCPYGKTAMPATITIYGVLGSRTPFNNLSGDTI